VRTQTTHIERQKNTEKPRGHSVRGEFGKRAQSIFKRHAYGKLSGTNGINYPRARWNAMSKHS
jgi:hypothetical protein